MRKAIGWGSHRPSASWRRSGAICLRNIAANGAAPDRDTRVACDRIVMYVYIVPHTLPETREIGDVSPFDVRVRIGYGGAPLSDTQYRINPWSGASLEIKLRNDGTPFRQ